MFNELTLSLHILLLVSIYLFLFVVVKTIAKDLSPSNAKQPVADDANAMLSDKSEENYPKIIFWRAGASGGALAYPIYDKLLIGRADDCDIVLDDNCVSSHHARVYCVWPEYWLEDLNSTNGTLFEQAPVDAPVRLNFNDEFRISENIFRFVE